jgi:hypothetical protein
MAAARATTVSLLSKFFSAAAPHDLADFVPIVFFVRLGTEKRHAHDKTKEQDRRALFRKKSHRNTL